VVYLARWLTGAPARPGPDRPVRRVVFVCHGNIIRSPLAEALCRREASAAGVALAAASAGLHAVPGRGADPRAADAAAALGVSLAAHSARLLSAEDVRLADLVLVMDYANDAEVAARFRWAWGKIRLLGSLAGAGPVIPDPYAQDAAAVRAAAARIAEAVRALVRSVGGGR
jgi:protein-tyrosine phosphatase